MVKLTYTKKKENWRISSMQMVKLICPHCGATLSIENGIDSFYCQYCGGKILLTGQDKNIIDAKVKLKEFEHKERMQHNQYTFQERIQQSNQDYEIKRERAKSNTIKSIIMAVLLVIMVLGSFVVMIFRK